MEAEIMLRIKVQHGEKCKLHVSISRSVETCLVSPKKRMISFRFPFVFYSRCHRMQHATLFLKSIISIRDSKQTECHSCPHHMHVMFHAIR